MKKAKRYDTTRFAPEVIREAYRVLEEQLGLTAADPQVGLLNVKIGNETWYQDNEDDFFADYRDPRITQANYERQYSGGARLHVLYCDTMATLVEIAAKSRNAINASFEVFERHLAASRLPENVVAARTKPTIFIGHGHSPLWRDLKDHLHDQHGYPIQAYEVGARAGHTVRDILEEMLDEASFAVLVMTGEDETAGGAVRARQDVIHEAGLFQGRLGFSRAIILLEAGTEEFSNLQGIQQIRFSKGKIKETFGDVLATLRREFEVRGEEATA